MELSSRDPCSRITGACRAWQDGSLRSTMDALVRAREQIAKDEVFSWDYAEDVCTLMRHTKHLPKGMILWHGVFFKQRAIDFTQALATSTERRGGELFGECCKLYRLHVDDPAPLGIAIGGSEEYEHETEILLPPGYTISQEGISPGVEVAYVESAGEEVIDCIVTRKISTRKG